MTPGSRHSSLDQCPRLTPSFLAAVNGVTRGSKKGRPAAKESAPFSIRLTVEERKILRQAAAGVPLGSYIRRKLLDGEPVPRRPQRMPVADQAALASVLAKLGQSRLSSNLNQLAKAAHVGALIVTPDVTAELIEACMAVKAMRQDLLLALGLRGDLAP
jgi:hypothetical protein